nr:PREDICTED: protein takeout-like [Bemisia tabaci]
MKINVAFLFACICSASAATSLIDKWGRCKISDPNLNECLSKACKNMVVDLRPGNTEHGIPPWEPFHINKMVLKSGGKGPVNMEMTMEDTTCTHISEYSDLVVDASNLKNMVLKMRLTIPIMNITSKYTMKGQMLSIPIKGKGDAKMHLSGLKLDIILKGKPLMKDGKTYWEVNVFEVVFNPTKAKFEYTGLFNGDKKLGEATNKVLNDNWKLMNKEFQPYISSEFGKTAIPIANAITQMEPFDEMFPK